MAIFMILNFKKSEIMENTQFRRYQRLELTTVRDRCFFAGWDTTLILILGLPLKTFTMTKKFYVIFMFNVSFKFYDDLNKTSDFWTNINPGIKYGGSIKLLLILKTDMIS